jgi:hypothetical protein
MPTVSVKYKIVKTGSSVTTSRSLQVTKIPPTESEVTALLKKVYPKDEFIILEIK